jgi:hypothetical protein
MFSELFGSLEFKGKNKCHKAALRIQIMANFNKDVFSHVDANLVNTR